MNWSEYILAVKEERKMSYGQLARLTRTSYSYWHNQIFQIKCPPTLEKARAIAEALEINADNFVNLVFKDRMIYYLEKQKIFKNEPTKEIVAFIESLRSWAPERGQKLRYIMLTLINQLGMNVANHFTELDDHSGNGKQPTIRECLRDPSFPLEAETGPDEFSECLEELMDLPRPN